jgi:thymidine kinase
MAKLYFYYSSMNAGKSTALLQSSYNYRERGMNTLVLAPNFDDRYGIGKVTSRIGLEAAATTFAVDEDLFRLVSKRFNDAPLHCVLIDEAQFLTKEQVHQLGEVTDELNIPVLAYGLRTDFQGEPFEGSKYLLAWADNLKELKAICFCGSKATMVIRLAEDGNAITQGSQVEIGGNDRYVSMCRKHFKENYYQQTLVPQHQLPLDVIEDAD